MSFFKGKKLFLLLAAIFGLSLIFFLLPFANINKKGISGNGYVAAKKKIISGEENASLQSRKKIEEKKKTADILFLGDLMLDRYERTLIERKGIGWITEGAERLFLGQDLNIANLEGPITEKKSVSLGTDEKEKNHFVFTFSPEQALGFLEKNRISAVSIGNNHILNFGKSGLDETEKFLESKKVSYFGDPENPNNYLIENINGLKICLINYNQFGGSGAEETAGKIKELKNSCDFLVVYAHWGKEYELNESEKQKIQAREFIDAGADMIVGSHPHVVQSMEIYKGKTIFYSLGNFIFDQYFSEDTRIGLALGVSFSGEKTDFILTPIYIEKNGKLVLADQNKKNSLLKRIAERSEVDNAIKNDIISGRFSISN